MGRSYLVLIFILLFLSCSKESNPRTYTLKKILIQQPEINTQILQKFSWDAPDYWIEKEIDASSLRLASYEIPLDDSENPDLSITKFPGDAGGVELNVNRWRGQLNLIPESLDAIQSNSIKGVSPLGDFRIYKIINDELNKGFLCMILELPSETIFVKLSSVKLNIIDLKNEFISFCSTFKIVKNE